MKPGGYIEIYVYWRPPRKVHRRVLEVVSTGRGVTSRLPHPVLHAFSYALGAGLFAAVVLPYRALRSMKRASRVADAFPLKTHAD